MRICINTQVFGYENNSRVHVSWVKNSVLIENNAVLIRGSSWSSLSSNCCLNSFFFCLVFTIEPTFCCMRLLLLLKFHWLYFLAVTICQHLCAFIELWHSDYTRGNKFTKWHWLLISVVIKIEIRLEWNRLFYSYPLFKLTFTIQHRTCLTVISVFSIVNPN